eukprot:357410-Chlamydomonas_euryale.AAC.5
MAIARHAASCNSGRLLTTPRCTAPNPAPFSAIATSKAKRGSPVAHRSDGPWSQKGLSGSFGRGMRTTLTITGMDCALNTPEP